MITADGGGSNGYRTRQWKTELAALAARTGLTIMVTHLPGVILSFIVDHGCGLGGRVEDGVVDAAA
jgi:hypothetical protein